MAMRYRPNEQAGDYTILQCLNTGAFAISYSAKDARGRKVFLKQYKSPSPLVSWYEAYKKHQASLKKRITSDRRLAERTYEFIDEYEHKNAFIQVYGFIEGGKDLKEYLSDGGMSVEQRFTFASLLLYTLKLFHAAGIVHTDLKPDNVYLMPSGAKMGYNLKLIDFDFTVLDGKRSPWDKTDAKDGMNYCGTPRYMSPEHLRSEMPTDKSDVFTAAIICCELLATGGHPFPEDETAYREAVLNGTFGDIKPIVKETRAVASFRDALRRAFSSNAKERPGIGELHSLLLNCRSDFRSVTSISVTKPGATSPSTSKGKASSTAKPSVPSGKPASKPSETGRKKKAVRLGLSMKTSERGDVDWFKITTTFGSHTEVSAVRAHRLYCSGAQFVLRRDGAEWYIEPAPVPPKNMVVFNGSELTESHRLSEGDVIALGSRKDPKRRNIEPMVVHLEDA